MVFLDIAFAKMVKTLKKKARNIIKNNKEIREFFRLQTEPKLFIRKFDQPMLKVMEKIFNEHLFVLRKIVEEVDNLTRDQIRTRLENGHYLNLWKLEIGTNPLIIQSKANKEILTFLNKVKKHG